MREEVRVAVAQIEFVSLDPAKNLEKMKGYCEKAEQEKADLVVFPKLASSGYCILAPGTEPLRSPVQKSPGVFEDESPRFVDRTV